MFIAGMVSFGDAHGKILNAGIYTGGLDQATKMALLKGSKRLSYAQNRLLRGTQLNIPTSIPILFKSCQAYNYIVNIFERIQLRWCHAQSLLESNQLFFNLSYILMGKYLFPFIEKLLAFLILVNLCFLVSFRIDFCSSCFYHRTVIFMLPKL